MKGFVVLLLVLLLATGCSGGGGSGTSDGGTGNMSSSETAGGNTGDSTGPVPETTQQSETTGNTTGNVNIEQVSSGSGGLRRPQVVVAPSADTLSEATGAQVPASGKGTYLAAFWGEKPTGGYTVEFLSARIEEDRVVVRLALKKPPPDAMVSQALTYPYAAAILRKKVPGDKNFAFVTQTGRELDWPVRRV